MRLLVILSASGTDADLLTLAERSVRREAPDADVLILRGPTTHGAKLDRGRSYCVQYDAAVVMDSDVVVWPGWRAWIERTLKEPAIVACGAPRVDDAWGLHPSMLALRGDLYKSSPSWEATPGADTGVAVCRWLETHGYLQGAPATRGDWWTYLSYPPPYPDRVYALRHALWWHLGSGSSSTWSLRCLWDKEAWWRWRRRRAFVQVARERLAR